MSGLLNTAELGHIIPADEPDIVPQEPDCALNIAGVYQDRLTRAWALHLCQPATRVAGEGRIQNTWYEVHRLGEPDVLWEAVRAALQADVIVISVHAADELPLDLYAWINAWLPRRIARAGALAAVIGVTGQPEAHTLRTQEYLQAVARRGQLDYVPHERKLLAGQ